MNKIVRYLIIAIVVFGVLFAAAYFIKSNSKASISYETETALITSIEEKTVATGKVVPEDEVEVKPQVQGILQALYVEEGDFVNEGDLLAKIKVVAEWVAKIDDFLFFASFEHTRPSGTKNLYDFFADQNKVAISRIQWCCM